jgi:hypothetical protein
MISKFNIVFIIIYRKLNIVYLKIINKTILFYIRYFEWKSYIL